MSTDNVNENPETVETIGPDADALQQAYTDLASEGQALMTAGDFVAYGSKLSLISAAFIAWQNAKTAANEVFIADEKTAILELLKEAVNGSRLEELTLRPVENVVFEIVRDEGAEPMYVLSVNVNMQTRKKTTRTVSPNGSATPGDRRDLKAEFDAKATADDKRYMGELDAAYKSARDRKDTVEAQRVGKDQWAARNKVSKDKPARPPVK